MLVILTCTCGNSETLVRKSLHRYEYKKWATEPIYSGKENSLKSVENLINKFPDRTEFRDLYAHINNSSKWVVFLGYNDDSAKWADIGHGQMKADAEAEVIVEKYGK